MRIRLVVVRHLTIVFDQQQHAVAVIGVCVDLLQHACVIAVQRRNDHFGGAHNPCGGTAHDRAPFARRRERDAPIHRTGGEALLAESLQNGRTGAVRLAFVRQVEQCLFDSPLGRLVTAAIRRHRLQRFLDFARNDSRRVSARNDSGRVGARSDSGRVGARSDSGRVSARSDSGRVSARSDSGRVSARSDSAIIVISTEAIAERRNL